MRWLPLFLLAALTLSVPTARAADTIDATAWRADLDRIASELPARHPNLFHRMTRASWDSAVTDIGKRLPGMNRNQAIVSFMKLVALARDGHTAINPVFDVSLGFRYYPLELYAYDDGLFVRSAAPAHASLVGARVVRIGRATADAALAAAGTTIPSENEWWMRTWAPDRVMVPEVLDGLGLVDDMEKLPIVVERNGKQETVVLSPAGKYAPRGHDPRAAVDRTGWVEQKGSGEAPLRLRRAQDPYWFEYFAPQKTLYVSYRMVLDRPGAPGSNVAFWRSVFAATDSLKPEKLVLDLRENIGGNSFFNRQVVRGIIRRNDLDRKDRLFVMIGPRTFSAAMNLATDLERWTNATFVGAPTGNATFFYGDHDEVVLPNSHIKVMVSTLPWRPYDPRDKRDFIAPAVYAPLTSGDDRTGRDPVMEAIQTFGKTPLFTEALEKAAVAGDSAAVVAQLKAEAGKVANRFRSVEADANTLGYSLMNSGRGSAALTVFRANTRVYPRSANAWDSYGEALLLASQHKDAVAAYQRALELNPQQESARQALARLSGNAPAGH
jgi:hypothetical protein